MKMKTALSSIFSAVLGIGIYLLVLAFSHSVNHMFDLTKNQIYTLSPQSKQVVRDLKQPVKVIAFEVAPQQKQHTREVLRRYKRENPSKFLFQVIDPDKRPLLAERFNIRTTGQAVIEFAHHKGKGTGRVERASQINENDLTNALMKLTRSRTLKLYFLTGDGERSLKDQGKQGLSKWRAALVQEGYNSSTLNLADGKPIPADAAAIVIAGPQTALLPGEQKELAAYLKKGGHLVLLAELKTPASYNTLLKPYGISIAPTVIIDQGSQLFGAQPVYAAGMAYSPTQPITRHFRENTIFLLARVVNKGKAPKGATLDQLIETSPYAFAVPVSKVLGHASLRFKPTKPASQCLAVTGKYPVNDNGSAKGVKDKTKAKPTTKASTRIIVVGDADAFSNALLDVKGNRDLGLNMMNWVSQSNALITIRGKSHKSKPLVLQSSESEWLFLVTVVFLPLLVLITGIVTAMRRRAVH